MQLPIVQAPFRIYWAYNFNRMAEVITAPLTQFPGNVNFTNSLYLTNPCPTSMQGLPADTHCFDMRWFPYYARVAGVGGDLWDSQVVPQITNLFNNPQRTNFFDPIRTLRFTVSRTF